MNPSTLQQIGRLYLQTSWCPAPLTAAEVQAHHAAKVELRQLCTQVTREASLSKVDERQELGAA